MKHCGSAKASSNQTLPDMQFAPPSASCLSLPSLPDVHAIPQLQKEAPQGADEYDGISRLANQLGKYELIRQVGSGNSGKVILAHRVGQKNVSPVVIKAVRRSNHKEFTERTTLNEVKTLQTVRATGNMSFVQLEESFADVYNRYFVFVSTVQFLYQFHLLMSDTFSRSICQEEPFGMPLVEQAAN